MNQFHLFNRKKKNDVKLTVELEIALTLFQRQASID